MLTTTFDPNHENRIASLSLSADLRVDWSKQEPSIQSDWATSMLKDLWHSGHLLNLLDTQHPRLRKFCGRKLYLHTSSAVGPTIYLSTYILSSSDAFAHLHHARSCMSAFGRPTVKIDISTYPYEGKTHTWCDVTAIWRIDTTLDYADTFFGEIKPHPYTYEVFYRLNQVDFTVLNTTDGQLALEPAILERLASEIGDVK